MIQITKPLSPEREAERLRQVREWAQAVAERFQPQKIILFGSYAYGNPDVGSDIDVLVVMDTTLKGWEQAVAITSAVEPPLSMDLLVRTPRRLAERLDLGDFFLREVVDKGVTLYAAPDG